MVMKYTVYKTVNLLNGKFYFGVHKTVNPDDEYLGSGTYIKRAVEKHGVQSFRKEVLFIYLDAESAFAKEDELVQCWRHHPLCKNLRKGGSGGFDWINKSVDLAVRNTKVSQKRIERLKTDPEFKARYSIAKSKGRKGIKGFTGKPCDWQGRTHRDESKVKMSTARSGTGNSQFGTCWIFSGVESKKISCENLPDWEAQGWKRGRKR